MSNIALALLLLAGADPAPLGADEDTQKAIVVTGSRLADTERALAACLARNCPPEEDINASLAHAENLFVAGDYRSAERTTKDSIERNDRHAAAYPEPVADLYRARARIGAHMGEENPYIFATHATRRILEDGLGPNDPRVVSGHLEVAAMLASRGRIERADVYYRKAIRAAERAKRPDLAVLSEIRLAWLYTIPGRSDITRKALRRIAADPRPERRDGRLAAMVLLARLDAAGGKRPSLDLSPLRGLYPVPVLVYGTPLDLPETIFGLVEPSEANPTQGMWIDVGFEVTPEGRVENAEILRRGSSATWAAPLLASIRGRLYTPSDGGRGAYRVERYTLTTFGTLGRSGSRLRTREEPPRVEYLDLTPDVPARAGSGVIAR